MDGAPVHPPEHVRKWWRKFKHIINYQSVDTKDYIAA